MHDVLRPALDAGEVVITDRFVDSSLAYQGAGRTIPLDDVRMLSRWATEGLQPDLTVLLDLPPEVGLARARGRAVADRLESESLEFHQRVRQTFRALAEAQPDRYLVLDARQSPDEIAAAIRVRVADLLSGLPLQQIPQPAADGRGADGALAAVGAAPPARADRLDPPAAPVSERPTASGRRSSGSRPSSPSCGPPSTNPAAMTHAWLFTGPPGSGRSVAARAFAAALQCPDGGDGTCHECKTVLAGTHADVQSVVPGGAVDRRGRGAADRAHRRPGAVPRPLAGRPRRGRRPDDRAGVQHRAEDARGAAAAHGLPAVRAEPAPRRRPGDHPLALPRRRRCGRRPSRRSPRCSSGATASIPALAAWSAAAAGGHVGRARRLARDEEARLARKAVLDVPLSLVSLAACLDAAADLVGAAKEESDQAAGALDGAETEATKASLGYGARGPGVAAASRGAGVLKELEKRQKSRATRLGRDSLDRALVDLAGLYRDALVLDAGPRDAPPTLLHPDRRADAEELARRIGAEGALRRIDALLACRTALEQNVKPQIARGGADRGAAAARLTRRPCAERARRCRRLSAHVRRLSSVGRASHS